MEADRFLV